MSLYVRESGPKDAPTIVFLHGGGVSGWMWQPQIEQLDDYHCLVPDLPEHGRSIETKPFTMKDSVAQIGELIQTRAHGGRAHVVGLSLGAQITLRLLSASSDLIDHAIVSGALLRPIRGLKITNALIRTYMPFKNAAFLIRANMKAGGIPEKYFAEVRDETRRITSESLAHVMAENMAFQIPAGLNAVTCPTLVLVGEKEKKIVHGSARDLISVLPNAKAYVAPNVGHAWNLQAPELFAQVIRAWINDKPLPEEMISLNKDTQTLDPGSAPEKQKEDDGDNCHQA